MADKTLQQEIDEVVATIQGKLHAGLPRGQFLVVAAREIFDVTNRVLSSAKNPAKQTELETSVAVALTKVTNLALADRPYVGPMVGGVIAGAAPKLVKTAVEHVGTVDDWLKVHVAPVTRELEAIFHDFNASID